MLNEFAEVIVLGDEPGIESTARELNLRHIPKSNAPPKVRPASTAYLNGLVPLLAPHG